MLVVMWASVYINSFKSMGQCLAVVIGIAILDTPGVDIMSVILTPGVAKLGYSSLPYIKD